MNLYNRRLATYSACSRDLKLNPFELARNGFSYDKNNLEVICDDCLVSFKDLAIASGIRHNRNCPNYEEHHQQRQKSDDTDLYVGRPGMSTVDTVFEHNPWKLDRLSPSRTTDGSEDKSNQVHGVGEHSSGEASAMLEDGDGRELSREWTCKICLDTEVSVVFLPCGHLVSCVQCATKIRICPICRTRILKTITARMA